jgi:hypothetical protein
MGAAGDIDGVLHRTQPIAEEDCIGLSLGEISRADR